MTLGQGLAILAGIVLAIIIAQGAWARRQASPRQADPVAPTRPADLGSAERREPALEADERSAAALGDLGQLRPGEDPRPAPEASDLAAAAALAAPDDPLLALEPGTPALGDDADAAQPAPPPPRRLDRALDGIAAIVPEGIVSGDAALTHLPSSRRAGSKPFFIEGLNDASGHWEAPQPGQRYRRFEAGVQLANRSGALNEIEFSEFAQKLQAFADAIDARVDLPDMLQVVRAARELDAFAAGHDAQLAVTLRANRAAWTVSYLQQALGRHGFVPGVLPGRMVMPSGESGTPPVLVFSFDPQMALADDPGQAAVREAQLSLDVPQTAQALEPFPAWQDAARRVSQELDATLVDDRGHPITLHAFVGIGEDLDGLYEALQARGLPAGSLLARRLFS